MYRLKNTDGGNEDSFKYMLELIYHYCLTAAGEKISPFLRCKLGSAN